MAKKQTNKAYEDNSFSEMIYETVFVSIIAPVLISVVAIGICYLMINFFEKF